MNNATAIALAGLFIALGLYFSGPRYAMLPVTSSANPAIWKIDMHNGDVFICATANGKDTKSGCTKKLDQF